MKAEDLYHTGHVYDDVEAAKAMLTRIAGYEWCETKSSEQVIQTPNGERTVTLVVCYSMSEPRIELVQAIPGTLWQTSDAGAHHLGYWSDDIDRDIEVLVANGYALDVKSIGHGGKPYWAYCGKKGGPRIELVAAMHKPYMAEYFRTGRMPRPAGV